MKVKEYIPDYSSNFMPEITKVEILTELNKRLEKPNSVHSADTLREKLGVSKEWKTDDWQFFYKELTLCLQEGLVRFYNDFDERDFKSSNKARLWRRMFWYFQLKQDEFMSHYHLRSNVESTFFMIKTKFNDSLKSKSRIAQINELLLKILCHNICVLIQEMFELGIEPNFIE